MEAEGGGLPESVSFSAHQDEMKMMRHWRYQHSEYPNPSLALIWRNREGY